MATGIVERRLSPRVPARMVVEWSDHYYEWTGDVLNLGTGGCYAVGPPLEVGKELQVKLRLPDQPPLELDATVAHARSDGMGLAFRLPDTPSFEKAASAVDRFVARDPELAARVRRHVRRIPPSARLFATPRAFLVGAARTSDERRALRLVGTGARVEDVLARGNQDAVSRAVLALLDRDLLTFDERRGSRTVPAPWLEEMAAVEAREGTRSEAAERYYQQARRERQEGNVRAALTSLRLALSLSPGDPQIEAELRTLEAQA